MLPRIMEGMHNDVLRVRMETKATPAGKDRTLYPLVKPFPPYVRLGEKVKNGAKIQRIEVEVKWSDARFQDPIAYYKEYEKDKEEEARLRRKTSRGAGASGRNYKKKGNNRGGQNQRSSRGGQNGRGGGQGAGGSSSWADRTNNEYALRAREQPMEEA